MGSDSRYDRYRHSISDREANEARALHTVGELLRSHPGVLAERRLAGPIANILDNTAIELNAGRGVPIGIRRAVLGAADALRLALDPRGKS